MENNQKKKPKYKVVEDYIIELIRSGKVKPGDQIETEYELSQKLNIGRLTVNKALINLANAGYINRIPGKGSFILSALVHKNFQTGGSFTNDMKSVGMKPGSRLINYKLIKAADVPEIAADLQMNPEEYLHYFVRVRTGDGTPIAISYTYLNATLIPMLDIRALEGSLNEYLESIGIKPNGGAVFRMSATLPTTEQKELLNVDEVALLRNAHVTYTDNNVPYEYIETYYLSSKYEYTFSTLNK